MKIAIMQPYLFPCIGYYQLVRCVDKFVVYDDVNYIKRGYINRNYILDKGCRRRFTVPVPGASIHKKISELTFSGEIESILEGIRHAYAKAPFFEEIFPLIRNVFEGEDRSISAVCSDGINEVFGYLGMVPDVSFSSQLGYDRRFSGAEKLMAICDVLDSRHYVNSIGGQALYKKEYFSSKGVDISFLKSREIRYAQGGSQFVANLSMIDVLMWCSKTNVTTLLDEYDLV
ncbi:WbqC family protein [Halomonas kalidii]|uniref:WbqC family protein n=1 Tax=Halomonas kalidii TaxID=3043293 RepID=A0ABT6VJK1_9GAMM|nr:WbqC family protein [Halomonas kalidii]MDI5934145.1 WbqC family protein [Halomonas kalidii]